MKRIVTPHPTEFKNQDDPEILTALDAALLLRVGIGSIYKGVRRKKIPHFYIGRLLRFRRSELLSIRERGAR